MKSTPEIDFVKEFKRIRDMGFIKSTRGKGDRAIGNTLEDKLDIIENNRSGPDFIDICPDVSIIIPPLPDLNFISLLSLLANRNIESLSVEVVFILNNLVVQILIFFLNLNLY